MKLFFVAAQNRDGVTCDHFVVAESVDDAIVLIAKVYLEPETVD